MSVTAEVCRLPGPVLVVLRDEAGRTSYQFASTLHQARQQARQAGAEAVSDVAWDDRLLPEAAPTADPEPRVARERQTVPRLRRGAVHL